MTRLIQVRWMCSTAMLLQVMVTAATTCAAVWLTQYCGAKHTFTVATVGVVTVIAYGICCAFLTMHEQVGVVPCCMSAVCTLCVIPCCMSAVCVLCIVPCCMSAVCILCVVPCCMSAVCTLCVVPCCMSAVCVLCVVPCCMSAVCILCVVLN